MKIGFVSKPECPRCIEMVAWLSDYLVREGTDVILEESTAREMKTSGTPIGEMECDVVVTVGGDGTALYTLKRVNSAVLPVNLGSLGFLSEVSSNNVLQALGRLMRGEYRVEERARIKTVLNGERLTDSVNEVVIRTNRTSKIRWFGMYIDDDFIHNIRADGIIIATPTGSTSYSLSVGGPILDPRVKALIVSHIAPFSLNVRSIVVPSESTIRVKILDQEKNLEMGSDGQEGVEVGYHDEIYFTESERPARFVRLDGDFYRNMREKML
ncbi:MAG: NAD(+)/NADH kinase [Thermoplasmatales archaeon]|jgi:NAD+ kinase|nr:NAD(+)/NADH kinase [Thermoplasmatales archaeon]